MSIQLLDARHRGHARVEDDVRTTKDTGLAHLPSHQFALNQAWCTAAVSRMSTSPRQGAGEPVGGHGWTGAERRAAGLVFVKCFC